MVLNNIPSRAFRYLGRRLGHLLSKPGASPSALSLKAYKELAWQSDKSASRYREDVDAVSPGMQTEISVAMQVGYGQILDVGAGTGRFSVPLCKAGNVVTSVDISAPMLQLARQAGGDALRCVRASAFAVPFPDNAFDTVLSFWLLVHFPEWRRIVSEMLRVAKPGGQVLFEGQAAENYEEARSRAPAAAFVARLQSPSGFHAFQHCSDVLEEVAGHGEIAWRRPYDFFNDNFLAQAILGDGYAGWLEQINKLLQEKNCVGFWHRFEAVHAPELCPKAARKMLYLVQKNKITGQPAPLERLPEPPPISPVTTEVKRLWELFREAFLPVYPALPLCPPSD